MSAGPATLDGPAVRHGGIFRRLYYGETRFDFVRRRRWWFAASGLVIAIGVVALGVRGLNFDIEFVGGTSWEVAAPGVSVAQAQSVMRTLGLPGATVTVLGSGANQRLNVEAKVNGNAKSAVSNTEADRIAAALGALAHKPGSSVSIQEVGPTWGSQITHKAVVALIVFLLVIAAYISTFFEWKMALAAIVAVAHDIVITVGIYAIFGLLVTPDTVVAFLTVLGYSLYDTIVVFDRVRDNSKGLGATGKLSYTDIVNLSMNQTLARSINTSLVAILPILSVLVLGAEILGATTLEYFGFALLIGLTSGAYSSIFIASPIVAMLKEREPRYRQIRERLETRGGAVQLLTPAAVAAGALTVAEPQAGPGSSKRRRSGARSPQRAAEPEGPPATLRPSAGRKAATSGLAVIEADQDEDEAGYDDDASSPAAPEAGSGEAAAPAGRSGTGSARGAGSVQDGRSTPVPGRAAQRPVTGRRPPPRARKKGKRR